jgi:catechol 2,3-dioxygenase-like lactoylglutathione lyase family enzyme
VAVLANAHIEAVVPVSDVEAALRFYGETLGLSVIERVGDADGCREVWLGAGDGSLTIYESEAAGRSGAGNLLAINTVERLAVPLPGPNRTSDGYHHAGDPTRSLALVLR